MTNTWEWLHLALLIIFRLGEIRIPLRAEGLFSYEGWLYLRLRYFQRATVRKCCTAPLWSLFWRGFQDSFVPHLLLSPSSLSPSHTTNNLSLVLCIPKLCPSSLFCISWILTYLYPQTQPHTHTLGLILNVTSSWDIFPYSLLFMGSFFVLRQESREAAHHVKFWGD